MADDALHESQASVVKRRVFCTETTEIVQGQAFCYDRAYAASSPSGRLAADPCGYRDKRVAFPTSTNNAAFAGVAAQNYSANAAGQWIDIYEPGSVCEIQTLIPTTVGVTMLTAMLGTGPNAKFGYDGFPGRGSALALQTVANVASNDATLVGPVSQSMDGAGSVNLSTFTHAGKFANAQVGDKIHVLGGSLTASGATQVTPGVYTIASVTSANIAVVTGAVAAATDHSVLFYVVRGNPTCLAKLETGEESGLVQVVTVKSAVEVIPALAVGGTTLIAGRATLAAACTATVPAATKGVRRKALVVLGTLVTSGVEVTAAIGLTTSAKNWTNVAKFTILATGNRAELSWGAGAWNLVGGIGIAP